jgi:hypothetical protein
MTTRREYLVDTTPNRITFAPDILSVTSWSRSQRWAHHTGSLVEARHRLPILSKNLLIRVGAVVRPDLLFPCIGNHCRWSFGNGRNHVPGIFKRHKEQLAWRIILAYCFDIRNRPVVGRKQNIISVIQNLNLMRYSINANEIQSLLADYEISFRGALTPIEMDRASLAEITLRISRKRF